MNSQIAWENLVAYSMQIGLLVGLAAFIPAVLRLRLPAGRLAYWHILLAACLLLPAVRPWKQVVLTLSAPVALPPHVTAPLQPPAAAPSLSVTEIALYLLGAGMLLRIAWLAIGFWRLARLRRHSHPLFPPSSWGVEADLRVSGAITGPVTFGLLRPVVLLPANFRQLDDTLQDAILCHEILHVRRRDWLFMLAEELVRCVFWFHPAIWWLLGEIGLAREQAVDREVVELTKSRDRYVDALLAIAGAKPTLDLAPAPLFLRKRHLKQRVVSILKEVRMSKTRSISALAAGLGMLAAACWLVTATFPLAAAPQMVADGPGVTVDAGGAVMHRGSIVYPEAARRKRAQGMVTVEATLDGSGNVLDTRVLNGPIELRRAAQQSVLNWHFATDSAVNTRLVKVNFELPPQALEPPPAAVSTPESAARPQAVAKLTEPQAKGTTWVGPLSPPALEGKRLTQIYDGGLSPQSRTDLMSHLPVRIGDTLAVDTMDRVRTEVRLFDEHLNVGTAVNSDGALALTIHMPGTAVSGETLFGSVGPADGTKRINIGGNVQQAKLISQPKPAYPPLAKQARIQGVVQLAAIIGRDGNVIDLAVLSGHPLLVPSALEAVRTWVYRTTLLNGDPVEVATRINVNYTLSDEPPIQ